VVNKYVQARPVNNTLAPFVPALARILAERTGNASALSEEALLALAANVTAHDITGTLDWGAEDYGTPVNDTSGLDGFIEAVQALGGDPIFRQVQDSAMDSLYYNPSQRASAALGLRLPLSKAQLYDAWVQHGSADPQSPVFARSANGIISCAVPMRWRYCRCCLLLSTAHDHSGWPRNRTACAWCQQAKVCGGCAKL
jgi:chitosanase